MPKMHQNTFGGRAPLGPAGELMRSCRTPNRSRGAATSKGREGAEVGRGPTYSGGKKRGGGLLLRGRKGGKGEEKGRKGRGREFPPKSM